MVTEGTGCIQGDYQMCLPPTHPLSSVGDWGQVGENKVAVLCGLGSVCCWHMRTRHTVGCFHSGLLRPLYEGTVKGPHILHN